MKIISTLKFPLAGAFLALIIYNFSIAIEQKYEVNGDAWDYIHLGISLAKTGKYGQFKASRDEILADFKNNNVKHKKYEFGGKTAFRPPIWPILIGGIFLVFGYSLTYLLIFKFLLHLAGVYIFYKTLKLLKIRELVLITGTFLYAISPAWQLYSRVFLSEPITLFFITLWIFLLIRFIKGSSRWWPHALIAGILVLCHPYYVFLPFSIWIILTIRKQISLRTFILASALCAAIISTWIIRNMVIFNTTEIVLTTSSGAVMAKGWNEDVIREHTNTKGDLADETLVLEDFNNKIKDLGEVEKMVLYKNASIHFIKNNTELILPIIFRKLKSALNPFPETPRPGILETGRWIFQFLALLALLYIVIFSNNRLISSIAWGLALSTIGITILTYSGFRFRMPQVGLELLFIIFVLETISFNKFRNGKKQLKTG